MIADLCRRAIEVMVALAIKRLAVGARHTAFGVEEKQRSLRM
jgi:hypothetical protein